MTACGDLLGNTCYLLPSGCYCPVPTQKSWNEAFTICRSAGMKLLSIESPVKQTEMQLYLPEILSSSKSNPSTMLLSYVCENEPPCNVFWSDRPNLRGNWLLDVWHLLWHIFHMGVSSRIFQLHQLVREHRANHHRPS